MRLSMATALARPLASSADVARAATMAVRWVSHRRTGGMFRGAAPAARPLPRQRRGKLGVRRGSGATPRQPLPGTREAWPQRVGWLPRLSGPEPACGRPPSRLSGHRPEQRPPGRHEPTPGKVGADRGSEHLRALRAMLSQGPPERPAAHRPACPALRRGVTAPPSAVLTNGGESLGYNPGTGEGAPPLRTP